MSKHASWSPGPTEDPRGAQREPGGGLELSGLREFSSHGMQRPRLDTSHRSLAVGRGGGSALRGAGADPSSAGVSVRSVLSIPLSGTAWKIRV